MIRVIAGILLMIIVGTSAMETEPLIVVLAGLIGWIMMMRGIHMFNKTGTLL